MVYLLKIVIFHCYVSSPEGSISKMKSICEAYGLQMFSGCILICFTDSSAVAQESRPRQTPSGTTARRTSLSVLGQVLSLIGSPAFLMTTCSINSCWLPEALGTAVQSMLSWFESSKQSEKKSPTSTLWLSSHGDQLGSFAVLKKNPGVSGAFFCALSESAGA